MQAQAAAGARQAQQDQNVMAARLQSLEVRCCLGEGMPLSLICLLLHARNNSHQQLLKRTLLNLPNTELRCPLYSECAESFVLLPGDP